MVLNKDDIEKFYTLKAHYDELSNVTGVIGDNKKLKDYVKKEYRSLRNSKSRLMMSDNGREYYIVLEDMDYIYKQIDSTDDLNGTYRRYV